MLNSENIAQKCTIAVPAGTRATALISEPLAGPMLQAEYYFRNLLKPRQMGV